MITVTVVNELSGTNMPLVYQVETLQDAKDLIYSLSLKDNYFEVGDVIKIEEV